MPIRIINVDLNADYRRDLNYNFSLLENQSGGSSTEIARVERESKERDDLLAGTDVDAIIQRIDTSANNADVKAQYAKEQGDFAKAQGEYAKTQGDFAKAQGEYAGEKAVSADAAATNANTAATGLDAIKTAAVDATQAANTAAEKANKAGFKVLGNFNNVSELPTNANPGDAYKVGPQGDIYQWTGTSWLNLGPIQGPEGPAGSDADVTTQNITAALGYTPANNTELDTLEQNFNTHVANQQIHVTQAKQTKWDGAQLYKLTNDNGKPIDKGDVDPDTLTDTGFFYCRHANMPSNDFYYLEVMGNSVTGYCTQKASYVFGQTMAFRTQQNGVWGLWETFLTSKNLVLPTSTFLPVHAGWKYYDDLNALRYYRDAFGVVNIYGGVEVIEGSAGNIGVMPVGYRPAKRREYCAISGAAQFSTITIDPDGTINTTMIKSIGSHVLVNISYPTTIE